VAVRQRRVGADTADGVDEHLPRLYLPSGCVLLLQRRRPGCPQCGHTDRPDSEHRESPSR